MKSSISATGGSPSDAPPTRSFNVLLADGSRLRVTCRDLAAQLRQERTAVLKRLRQARAEALADVADRIGEARIRREYEAAEREMDAAIRRLSKQVRIKPERPRASPSGRSPRARPVGTGHSGVTITRHTASALARRDRLGREGMMLRIRYVRAGGRHASPGCLRRHYRYIAREAAVTLDSDGKPIVLGNIGDTVDQVVGVLDIQEQVLRATRKNAKLGFRMVGAFPYGLPVDARRAILQRIGDEVFGERGLPWTAAAHDADPGASVDNPHFHLDYSLLPTKLQADGSVVVSNDLRTDLDGQEGLRFIRHSVARVMTEVAREYSLDREFTALSYRERGMDREGGEHVGQEGTAAHRRGEHVASIARNEARQLLAEARERARRARDRADVLERLRRAIVAAPAAPEVASVAAAIGDGVTMPPAPAIEEPIGMTAAAATEPMPRMLGFDGEALLPVPPAAPDVGDGPQIGASVPKAAPTAFTSVPGVARLLPPVVSAMVFPPIGDAPAAVPMTRAVPTLAMSVPSAPTPGPAPTAGTVLPRAPRLDRAPVSILQADGTAAHRDAPLPDAPPSMHSVTAQPAPITPSAPPLILPPVAPPKMLHAIGIVTDIPSFVPTVASTPVVNALAVAPDVAAVPPATVGPEAWSPAAAAVEPMPAISDAGTGAPMMPSVPPFVARPAPAPAIASVPTSPSMPAAAPSLHDQAVEVVIVAGAAPATASLTTLAIVASAPNLNTDVPVAVTIGSEAPSTAVASLSDLPRDPALRVAAVDLPHPQAMLAPAIVDIPVAGSNGNTAPVIETPPTVTRIGNAASVPAVAEPVIWSIGKAASSDADEHEIERRIREVLERDEARRRDADARETVQRDLDASFAALRRHDEWMRQDEDGLYTVSDSALRVSGLSRADLAIPAVQAALEAIGIEQVDRLGPTLDAVGGPPPLRVEGGAIRLDDRFGQPLRDDVARWSGEPGFRAFVATVWPQLGDAVASTPPPAPARPQVAPPDPRERAVTAMIAAIAEERHYLDRSKGTPVIGADILARFDLSPADVAGEDAKKRLATVAERQFDEVVRIANHVRAAPHDIVADGDGWLLDEAAPGDVRRLVAAWRNDPTMQQALGRAVAVAAGRSPLPAPEPHKAGVKPIEPGDRWRAARERRNQAMTEWDEVERLDGAGLPLPGRRLDRPGAKRTQPAGQAATIARWMQGRQGPGW